MARVRAARADLFLLLPLALSACAALGGPGTIGAVLGRDNESRALFVREAPPGLGAEQAGLRPGDEIVMIDGHYVKDLTSNDLRARLRGASGTTVALTVVRGDEVRHVVVKRAPLQARRPPPPREERIVE